MNNITNYDLFLIYLMALIYAVINIVNMAHSYRASKYVCHPKFNPHPKVR